VDEKDSADEYRCHLAGTHSYCTSECNQDPLRFVLTLDKASGEMRVVGE